MYTYVYIRRPLWGQPGAEGTLRNLLFKVLRNLQVLATWFLGTWFLLLVINYLLLIN